MNGAMGYSRKISFIILSILGRIVVGSSIISDHRSSTSSLNSCCKYIMWSYFIYLFTFFIYGMTIEHLRPVDRAYLLILKNMASYSLSVSTEIKYLLTFFLFIPYLHENEMESGFGFVDSIFKTTNNVFLYYSLQVRYLWEWCWLSPWKFHNFVVNLDHSIPFSLKLQWEKVWSWRYQKDQKP